MGAFIPLTVFVDDHLSGHVVSVLYLLLLNTVPCLDQLLPIQTQRLRPTEETVELRVEVIILWLGQVV